nr:MAG TPA: hypothetical protein [Crassvirales sp.]
MVNPLLLYFIVCNSDNDVTIVNLFYLSVAPKYLIA